MAQTPSEMPWLQWKVDVMSPRPGDSYKSPTSRWGLSSTNKGPFYNISVTLDKEALDIVNTWPRGTKSERIRYAIKDRHYGNSPQVAEYIETLLNSISRLQARLGDEILKNEVIPEPQLKRSFVARVLHRLSILLRMPGRND